MFRFVFKLKSYGHDLAPDAPIKVEPFMPAIWGEKQIGNFSTQAAPATGSYLIAAFAGGVILLTLYHLVEGRRRARKARLPPPTSATESASEA